MNSLMYLLPVYIFVNSAPQNTQPSFQSTNKSFFRIGDQLVTIEKYNEKTDKDYVLVNLYPGDIAATRSSLNFSENSKVSLLSLKHNGKKNIEAELFDKKLSFDPGRVFTSWGRRVHLKLKNCWSRLTGERVQQFARFVLDAIPDKKTVVMLSSNSGESITDYTSEDKNLRLAKDSYQNPLHNEKDFFVTGDAEVFSGLKEKGFNAVLLHPKKQKDNGSLSVYCIKSMRPFVTVIARTEDASQPLVMLKALDGILK